MARFTDRVPCHLCDLTDPYELCPNMDNPEDCPQMEHAVTVKSVSLSHVDGKLLYTINGAYEFSEEEIQRSVRFGTSDIQVGPEGCKVHRKHAGRRRTG